MNVYLHQSRANKQPLEGLQERPAADRVVSGNNYEAILGSLMENTEAHLAYLDLNFNFVIVNSAYAKGAGYRKEELIGRNHFELFPNEENQLLFELARDTGKSIEFKEKPFEYPDDPQRGTTFWDWSLTPLIGIRGETEGFAFSLVDVTEVVRARKLSEELNRLNNIINSTFNFEDVATEVIGTAAEAMACNTAWIILRQNRNWVLKYGYGLPSIKVAKRLGGDETPVTSLCARRKRPVIIKNMDIDDFGPHIAENNPGVKALVAVPLIIGGKVVGAIAFNYSSPTEFSDHQINFVASLGGAISLALENSRLYRQLQQHRDRLEEIVQRRTIQHLRTNEILALFTSKSCRQEYMDSIVTLIRQWCRCKGVVLKILDYEEGIVCYEARTGQLNPTLNVVSNIPVFYREEIIGEIQILDQFKKAIAKKTVNFIESMTPLIGEAIHRFRLEEANRWSLDTQVTVNALLSLQPQEMATKQLVQKAYDIISAIPWLPAESFQEIFAEISDDIQAHDIDSPLSNLMRETVRRRESNQISGNQAIFRKNTEALKESLKKVVLHHRLEEEMAKLDRLNLIGEMAAGIGHEVRNPMTTARGFLQLLQEKPGCAEHKEYFNLIIEELDRANDIITEFLSMAKNRPVELEEHDLNQIIEAVFSLIQADATLADKTIELRLGQIQRISLDEKEIRQLLLNLVRNGLEAMDIGGNLVIETFSSNGLATLAIRDQGPGIDPEMVSKIGTPFFTTKENGTGLGLAICYSIANRHNAKMDFDSSPQSTTFYIRFKAKKEA